MVSKLLFTSILNHLQRTDEMSDDLQNIFREYDRQDFCDGASFRDLMLESYMITLLEQELKDKNGFTSWWIFDTNFGKKNPVVVLPDGGIKRLETAGELYDFLTNS